MTAPTGVPRPFPCLWCGRSWQPGSDDDLEARARLCPDCLARAGENPFIRFRLRAGLEQRAAERPAAGAAERPAAGAAERPGPGGAERPAAGAAERPGPGAGADPDDLDAWYLRRGRHAHGPVHDLAWQMELDAATTWLDGLPVGGRIVELGAGTGWWSALLATKGELAAYDPSGTCLDRARDRLVAHRLRAHLHVGRSPDPGDDGLDAVVLPFALGRTPPGGRLPLLADLAGRLRPGGILVVLEARADPATGSVPGAISALDLAPTELATLLGAARLADVDVRATGRFFLLGRATCR